MAKKVKKINVTEETVFKRNEEDFLITEVDGEAVMMNVLNGSYWGLNGTSTEIWNLLEQPNNYVNIVQELLKIYDVDEDICRRQTLQVILNMCARQVLIIEKN